MKHIRVRRMWEYAHFAIELTEDEYEHLRGCGFCVRLFRFCMSSDASTKLDRDEPEQHKSHEA